jgi:YebC/PmpR family DNA-binding regulatory protein
MYEGYGPGGVALIVEAMTDNRNRTAADIRHYFDKYGGNLGTTGCVSFLFGRKGQIIIEKTSDIDAEQLMLEAIDAGAEDFAEEEGYFEIITEPQDFHVVRASLTEKYDFVSSEITMIPSTWTKIEDADTIVLIEKMIDSLEDLDDVQNIYHNLDQEE